MGRRLSSSSSATNPARIPVASIAHNPRNARDNYDDTGELAESMREYGVLQPLGVVRYEIFLAHWPEHEDDIGAAHWVVMQGNRRLAAARAAGLDEVPVIVQEQLGRSDRLDESILVENVHRADLPHLRQAALLQQLVDKHGGQRAVAKVLSKTPGWVNQRLSLLKLVPELQAMLAGGELTVEQARDLSRVARDNQLASYDQGPPFREPDPAEPDLPEAAPDDAVAVYDVNTQWIPASAPESTSATERPAAAAAPKPAKPSGGGQSNARLVTALRRRSPDEVAAAIRDAYDSDQLEHLAKLLADQ